jgi:DNA repair exonuclease SbcCD nuclease subunit
MSDRLDAAPLGTPLECPSDRINLICAHADTTSPISKYAPSPLSLFAASGCVYAALGHVHNPPEPAVSGLTLVAYCGCPEGRSFDELHFGGVLSVTVHDGNALPTLERITVATHRYEILHVDVTGEDCDGAVLARMRAAVEDSGFGAETSLRIVLEGAVPTDFAPNTDSLAAALSDEFALCSLNVKDSTLPVYSADELKNDLSIRGAFYRALLPKLESADADERATAADALRIGLLALDGRAFMTGGSK